LDSGKLRARTADTKVYDAIFNAVQGENAPCFYEARAASKTWIKGSINQVIDFSIAAKVFSVYSRHG
jgi:hypothetical protein